MSKTAKEDTTQVINCSNVLKGHIKTGSVELQYPASEMRKTRERDYRGLYLRGEDSLSYMFYLSSVLEKHGDRMELMNKLNMLKLCDLLSNAIEGDKGVEAKNVVAVLYEKFGPKEAQPEVVEESVLEIA